jgi:hypothetical protein
MQGGCKTGHRELQNPHGRLIVTGVKLVAVYDKALCGRLIVPL